MIDLLNLISIEFIRKHKMEPTDEVDAASTAKRVKKDEKEDALTKEELKKQVRLLCLLMITFYYI